MKFQFSQHNFEKYSNINFYENPLSGGQVIPCRQMERHAWQRHVVPFAILRMFMNTPSHPLLINQLNRRACVHVQPHYHNTCKHWPKFFFTEEWFTGSILIISLIPTITNLEKIKTKGVHITTIYSFWILYLNGEIPGQKLSSNKDNGVYDSAQASKNRQNINICIRNLDPNKERKKVIEHFWEESV